MANGVWANYFEDVPHRDAIDNLNQYSPLELARYLLDRPDLDPAWREHASGLIGFVERRFGADAKEERGVVFGATTISEQDDYMYKMVSHTGRFASVLARFAEVTGDREAREKAFRSLNWSTYMCDERGLVKVGPKERTIWFTDGYGDNIRHLVAAMGAQPEWAPTGENHLLRSTSVIKQVEYGDGRVSYQAFDADGEEVLRLAFAPAKVEADGHPLARQQDGSVAGWRFDSGTSVLRIKRAGARHILIAR